MIIKKQDTKKLGYKKVISGKSFRLKLGEVTYDLVDDGDGCLLIRLVNPIVSILVEPHISNVIKINAKPR